MTERAREELDNGAAGVGAPAHCRFDVTPPRHFVYPAILLLLSEKPRHGYRLIDPIESFGLGPVDRPAVYRALADLETDGLVEKWNAVPQAGSTRHVYAVTEAGRVALSQWISVISTEREQLDRVVQRHALLSHPHQPARQPWTSPAWSTKGSMPPHSASDVIPAQRPARTPATPTSGLSPMSAPNPPVRFDVNPEASAILIRARSNVGIIEFGTTGVRGTVAVPVRDGAIANTAGVAAHLEVDVASLTSGNALYDAELARRVQARNFPRAVVDLEQAEVLAPDDRYRIAGQLTFHGVTTPLSGAVSVTVLRGDAIVVSGEEVIDFRDFDIAPPTMLMLKIYPDVRVFLHVEARVTAGATHRSTEEA